MSVLPSGRHVALPGRGTTFAFDFGGPPGAGTVILLHGWTATAELNWRPTFRSLSQHFRVVALDHRGHGRGIRSRRGFRLSDCADDVAALAVALGIEHFIAAGYSMGGPVAELTWKRHPARVAGLVLCATASRFAPAQARTQALFSGMYGLSLAAKVTPPALRRRAMDGYVARKVAAGPSAAWVASELQRNDPAALLQAGAAVGRFDCRPWIGEVDVPTAVVVTTRDELVRPERQRALAARIPGAKTFDVEGGHSVCAERPELFVPTFVHACLDVSRRATSTARS
jgi:pimeloyl-ACP methyl ester carboxylesterase